MPIRSVRSAFQGPQPFANGCRIRQPATPRLALRADENRVSALTFDIGEPVLVRKIVPEKYWNASGERWFLHELRNGQTLGGRAVLDLYDASPGLQMAARGKPHQQQGALPSSALPPQAVAQVLS